jgi:hypothetical protein
MIHLYVGHGQIAALIRCRALQLQHQAALQTSKHDIEVLKPMLREGKFCDVNLEERRKEMEEV